MTEPKSARKITLNALQEVYAKTYEPVSRETLVCVTLSFAAKNMEHELFRSCMQSVVAMRQGWSKEAMAAQADRLEACAREFIASDKFK